MTARIYTVSYDALKILQGLAYWSDEVLAAAHDGLTVYDRDGDAYRLAANWRGWCTLVNPLGVIIHSWAGNFSILPPPLQGVRT